MHKIMFTLLMPLLIIIFFKINMANVDDYLYSNFNTQIPNVFAVLSDIGYQYNMQMLVSLDPSTLSIVTFNYLNGTIIPLIDINLPSGVNANQLSDFYVSSNNVYFLSNANNVVSLNTLSLSTNLISTMSLFTQSTDFLTGALGSNENYGVLSVSKGVFSAININTATKTILNKSQLNHKYVPTNLYQFIATLNSYYLLEVDREPDEKEEYLNIQSLQWGTNSLKLETKMGVGIDIANLLCNANDYWVVIGIVSALDTTLIDLDPSNNFQYRNETDLSYTPLLDNSLFYAEF